MSDPSRPYARGLAFRCLSETKYHPGMGIKDDLGSLPHPDMFKMYPGKRFPLPKPKAEGRGLFLALEQRRSKRRYTSGTLSLENLGALCYATQGVTGQSGPFVLRTAPSAGALYPFETYVFVTDVKALDQGLYHLDVREFALVMLQEGDLSNDLYRGCLNQAMAKKAQATFVWTHVLLRCAAKYRNRALRYIFLDLGHVCQNLTLAAAALDLGCCPIGAFLDDELNKLIGVDGVDESVVYLATVGLL